MRFLTSIKVETLSNRLIEIAILFEFGGMQYTSVCNPSANADDLD